VRSNQQTLAALEGLFLTQGRGSSTSLIGESTHSEFHMQFGSTRTGKECFRQSTDVTWHSRDPRLTRSEGSIRTTDTTTTKPICVYGSPNRDFPFGSRNLQF